MNKEEYQEFVKTSASPKYDNKLAVIGLMGEVGEVADVIKKETIYEDMSKFVEKYGMSLRDKVVDECGDVMWQLVCLLNMYDISIDECMNKNFLKLTKRHNGVKTAKDGGGVR